MAIAEMNTFAREDVFPSWWANSVQKYLSVGGLNFSLTKQDATHVHTIAGAADEAAAIAIDGKWRWSEVTVSRAHPGGAAGTYDIFAVAKANKIVSSPEPGTDETPYGYELRILKAGETPPIEAGVVDIFRKVGSCEWSGTEITRVDQTAPLAPTHAHRHATGQPDAIAPLDIGAAPLTGVAGNFTVVGVLASESPVDLSIAKGTTAAAGTQTGDKLALYSSGNTGFGLGVQTNRLVAYTPTTGAFAVRKASNAGNASSGTDAVLLWPTGAIQSFGGPTLVLDARTAAADANAFFSIDNKGKMAWGVGGGTATDTSLERSGVGALTLAGALNINGAVKVTTGAVTSERSEGSTAFQTWVSGVSTINPWVVDTLGKQRWGAPTGALDVTLERSAAGVLKVVGTLQATKAITGEASASTNNATSTLGVANVMQAPQNTVSLFVGYGGNASAFTATEYSGAIRFGGLSAAWGDIAYFPTDGATNGDFRLYRDGTTVGTGVATATLGVGGLFVQGALAHRGTTLGVFNTAPVAQSAGWGTPTPPGGTYKTPLTYASTMNNIVDYVDTLATALKAYGILGA